MKKFFTLLSFAFSSTLVLNAQLLVEDFDYTAGQPLTSNSWTQVGTVATNPMSVANAGLSFTGYANSGIGNAATLINTGQDVYKDFSPVTDGSVYISLMMSVDSAKTGDYCFAIGTTTSTTILANRLYVKASGTNFIVGIGKGSENANYGATLYNYNTTYVIVLKYTFNTVSTTDDRCSLFMFDATIPTTEPATPYLVDTASAKADLTQAGRIFLRQGTASSAAGVKIDGIRVATDWLNAPLPVALTSFNASLINNQASLVWNTANEVNVNGYSIEKSNNGKDFNAIGFIAAKNASSASYSYNDVLANGVNYYRLKISGKDASIKYSSIVAINNKQSTKLEVYPNPVTNTATLTHEIATTKATIKVVTVDGKNVYTQNLQVGATQTSFDVSKLLKGNYVVVFENGTTRTSLQFVKQ